MTPERFKELQEILYNELFIGVPGSADMGDKIGLIAMICYLQNALKQKKPDITHAEVIQKCIKSTDLPYIDKNQLDILALMCEWFATDCTKFPNLGLKAKDMPERIADQISNLMPF